MQLWIHGRDLPGIDFTDPSSGRRYERVHVGLQQKDEAVQLVPADAPRATFVADVEVIEIADGLDFRGAFVHGRRGDRFLYLTWGERAAGDDSFKMFRRAKLLLRDVDEETLTRAGAVGWALEASLGLTDARGGPRCASVRPPDITWTAARVP